MQFKNMLPSRPWREPDHYRPSSFVDRPFHRPLQDAHATVWTGRIQRTRLSLHGGAKAIATAHPSSALLNIRNAIIRSRKDRSRITQFHLDRGENQTPTPGRSLTKGPASHRKREREPPIE